MILLASNSQTRAALLEGAGVPFLQKGCDFDEEQIKADSPKNFVYQAVLGKFAVCEKEFGLSLPLLVADTVVTAGGEILRKAKDKEDARRILEAQSGKKVSIITCMKYVSTTKMLLDISATEYLFKPFDEKELERYLDSGEWQGKAGACMVEGFCRPYIDEVYGHESTAMGLCLEKLLPFLD
ncbi:MAG: septum formation inhibitor Maf [Sulfurospirillum sp.]|nr:MAG: septum formation inhibitor Maf [Sulfurospirillum sp.]